MQVTLDFQTDYLPPRQILTGFLMLAAQGVIDLDLSYGKRLPNTHPERALVRAQVGGRSVAYDVADDYYFDRAKTEELLSSVTHYFKRSFDPLTHAEWTGAEKIHRLGFNYHAEIRHRAFFALDLVDPRQFTGRRLRRIMGHEPRPLVDRYEVEPTFVEKPMAMFYARLWDPAGESRSERTTPEVAEHRKMLNEMRAACVRQLREAFGDRFSGGLEPTPFTLAHPVYSGLIKNRSETSKRAYLERMHRTDVCVGSLGLGDANGWRVGEYVAAARAIVNERMRYLVPGDFDEGKNYLGFTTADECIVQVGSLLDDPDAVYAMKRANQAYYREYLRPDRMIWNTLVQIDQPGGLT
jgi:hypothetical protein